MLLTFAAAAGAEFKESKREEKKRKQEDAEHDEPVKEGDEELQNRDEMPVTECADSAVDGIEVEGKAGEGTVEGS